MFTKDSLVSHLRSLDQQLGPDWHAQIVVRRDDHFDWKTLECCAHCLLSGHQHGQTQDVRFATETAEGLHARFYPDRVEFHLDLVDACRDLMGHVLKDTEALPGAILGGLIGALLDGPRGASLGAIAGGAIGAQLPARKVQNYELKELGPPRFS